MTIIIIEDEVKTAKALGQLILSIRPDAQILSYIQSIDGAVSYLLENDQPDLIFMDIQLADGQCFEIFKMLKCCHLLYSVPLLMIMRLRHSNQTESIMY